MAIYRGDTSAGSAAVDRETLASTEPGRGASLVGIEDAAGNFDATNVEAALAELQSEKMAAADLASTANGKGASLVGVTASGNIASTNVQDALEELDTEKASLADLASTASGKGASLVGIQDSPGNFSSTTVEGALSEIITDLVPRTVATLTALKALSGDNLSGSVYLLGRTTAGDGGQGVFRWVGGDQSANVTADTQAGVWVPPDSDATGASGAWKRQYSGALNVKWFGATGDGSTDDVTALQAALDFAADAGGGVVFFPRGTYVISSQLDIDGPRVWLIGSGWSSVIKASAAMTQMISFLGATEKTGGGIRDIRLDGNSKAANGILVDSWHGWVAADVYAHDLSGRLALVTCSVGSTNTEAIFFHRCEIAGSNQAPTGLAKVSAGAGGFVTEAQFYDCSATQLTGWAIELEDASRCYIENLIVGNNSAAFSGGVYISNPGSAAGAPSESGQHTINNVHVEDQSGGGSAIGVLIEAPTGATTFLRYNRVMGVDMSPTTGRTIVELRNTSATANLVRENIIGPFKQAIESADAIKVGANCAHNHIIQPGLNTAKLSTSITDNGSHTRVNGIYPATAYGQNTAPPTTQLDVGDIVPNSSDNTVWLIDKSGTARRVGVGNWLQTGSGSPEGSVTSRIGSFYQRTDGGVGNSTYQKVSGTGNTGWCPLGVAVDTATNIADAAATINTADKHQGRLVWDTTNMRLMVASGSGATDAWYVADGSASVTPS